MVVLTKAQIEDASIMAELPDVPNFSKAGTGKTYAALEAVRVGNFQRGLVLAPPIALSMWTREIDRYLGATVQHITNGKAELQNTDFHICSYDMLRGGMGDKLREHYKGGPKQALICDESHYLRSYTAKRTIEVYGPHCLGTSDSLVAYFDSAWMMTGTPIVSFNDDLYPLLRGLYPDMLARYKISTHEEFLSMFTVRQNRQYHKNMRPVFKVIASTNEALMNTILYDDIMAIRRTIIEGLPPITVRELRVAVSKSGLDTETETIRQLAGMSLEKCMAALQSRSMEHGMSKMRRVLGLMKVHGAIDYIFDSALSGPVLVGVVHRDVGSMIEKALSKYERFNVKRVYGDTAAKAREAIQRQFNAGEIDILIGQMQSMGVSWNIQDSCRHIIVLEDDYSPATIEQFYKRVYRRGQTQHCQLDFLRSNIPLDEAMKIIRLGKEQQANAIIG